MFEFRQLRADEIDCRVSRIVENKKTGKVSVVLLLYKDARCDMNILDETVGPLNWQRDHKEVKGVCYAGVAINRNYDDPSKPPEWVWKWDAGVESRTERQKGESSDSFKRACFNLGIGRALYTAPTVWVDSTDCLRLYQDDDKSWKCFDDFTVRLIDYENGAISKLVIENTKSHVVVFTHGRIDK